MANPIFESPNQGPVQGGGIFGMMFNRMYKSNPAFRDFANSMKGMSESEMCNKCGVDPSVVQEAKNNPEKFFTQMGML